ncbi:MAG: hypothetical protein GX660_25505 [Clostridiaceae bacterium]|nr:hypothetical protein [Clostridiaceae bacterium]
MGRLARLFVLSVIAAFVISSVPAFAVGKAEEEARIVAVGTAASGNSLVDEYVSSIETKLQVLEMVVDTVSKQYGEDSKEAGDAKEKVKVLENYIEILKTGNIAALKEIVKKEGNNVDLEKYNWLGALLSKAGSGISIFVDGTEPVFGSGVTPMVEEGRTLVPFRAVAECIGAEVLWNDKLKKVTVKKGDRLVELTIGSKSAFVNTKLVELDVPAKIVEGRTVLPLRFVSESLDATVTWIPDGKVIVIKDNKAVAEPVVETPSANPEDKSVTDAIYSPEKLDGNVEVKLEN